MNAQTIFLYSVINKFLRSFSSKFTRNAIGQLILLLLLFSGVAFSAEFNGHVVHIADGDTLTILTGGNEQIKVRLAEIDAPEKKQPFGQRSKQSLSDLCFNKDATLQKTDADRFGRTVAKVYCDGTYANAEQVRAGMAWAYRKYLHDKSLLDLECVFRPKPATDYDRNPPPVTMPNPPPIPTAKPPPITIKTRHSGGFGELNLKHNYFTWMFNRCRIFPFPVTSASTRLPVQSGSPR